MRAPIRCVRFGAIRPTSPVDAPWFWVKVVSGKGFLLDLHGTVFEVEALTRILTADWEKSVANLPMAD